MVGGLGKPHAESGILVRFMQIFSIAIHAFSLGILMGHTHKTTDNGISEVAEPRGPASFLRFLFGRAAFAIFHFSA